MAGTYNNTRNWAEHMIRTRIDTGILIDSDNLIGPCLRMGLILGLELGMTILMGMGLRMRLGMDWD